MTLLNIGANNTRNNKLLKFSANLGFLWNDLSLPQAIKAASQAGFKSVEVHWPYEYDAEKIAQVLQKNKLDLICLNTALGTKHLADFGLCAMSGRENEAKILIDQAIKYAIAVNSKFIHVMSGKSGRSGDSENVFRKNLSYACVHAAKHNITILIEPINLRDVAEYHLYTVEQAVETVEAVAQHNIKVMFDCYHIQIMQGDLCAKLEAYLPYIGHIQIAAVPDRGEPNQGEINYPYLLNFIQDLGWQGYIGAEYKPRNGTENGLKWLQNYR